MTSDTTNNVSSTGPGLPPRRRFNVTPRLMTTGAIIVLLAVGAVGAAGANRFIQRHPAAGRAAVAAGSDRTDGTSEAFGPSKHRPEHGHGDRLGPRADRGPGFDRGPGGEASPTHPDR